MIEVTAKYNCKNDDLMEDDYFKETVGLVTHKYNVTVENVTEKASKFLQETARYCGTEHYCDGECDDHVMKISAQGMINWGRAVFCPQDEDIVELIQAITKAITELDSTIAAYLVSDCVYRNGVCTRQVPCGRSIEVLQNLISVVPERYYRDARNEKLIADIKNGKGVN